VALFVAGPIVRQPQKLSHNSGDPVPPVTWTVVTSLGGLIKENELSEKCGSRGSSPVIHSAKESDSESYYSADVDWRTPSHSPTECLGKLCAITVITSHPKRASWSTAIYTIRLSWCPKAVY